MIHNIRAMRHNSTLLTTPSSIFASLIRDLHRARRSIDMEYYIFEADRIGSTIIDILTRKAHQGVVVRLLIDGYGSRRMPHAMLARLLAAGVKVQRNTLLSHSRNHRKMAIIDKSIAHVGGINIADRYVVGNGLGLWHDVELRFTGETVATLAMLFEHDTNVAMGKSMEPLHSQKRHGLQLYWSEAEGGKAIGRLLSDIITTAEQSITLTTPYFMPPRDTLELLAAAVSRGVRVEVIIPERSDIWALDELTRRFVARAETRGIELRILRGAFLHAKLALVDHRRTILGSANLDARSLHINRELMLSTYDRGVSRAAENFLHEMRSKSTSPRRDDLRSAIPAIVTKLLEPVL